jgi:hypothetical protein
MNFEPPKKLAKAGQFTAIDAQIGNPDSRTNKLDASAQYYNLSNIISTQTIRTVAENQYGTKIRLDPNISKKIAQEVHNKIFSVVKNGVVFSKNRQKNFNQTLDRFDSVAVLSAEDIQASVQIILNKDMCSIKAEYDEKRRFFDEFKNGSEHKSVKYCRNFGKNKNCDEKKKDNNNNHNNGLYDLQDEYMEDTDSDIDDRSITKTNEPINGDVSMNNNGEDTEIKIEHPDSYRYPTHTNLKPLIVQQTPIEPYYKNNLYSYHPKTYFEQKNSNNNFVKKGINSRKKDHLNNIYRNNAEKRLYSLHNRILTSSLTATKYLKNLKHFRNRIKNEQNLKLILNAQKLKNTKKGRKMLILGKQMILNPITPTKQPVYGQHYLGRDILPALALGIAGSHSQKMKLIKKSEKLLFQKQIDIYKKNEEIFFQNLKNLAKIEQDAKIEQTIFLQKRGSNMYNLDYSTTSPHLSGFNGYLHTEHLLPIKYLDQKNSPVSPLSAKSSSTDSFSTKNAPKFAQNSKFGRATQNEPKWSTYMDDIDVSMDNDDGFVGVGRGNGFEREKGLENDEKMGEKMDDKNIEKSDENVGFMPRRSLRSNSSRSEIQEQQVVDEPDSNHVSKRTRRR